MWNIEEIDLAEKLGMKGKFVADVKFTRLAWMPQSEKREVTKAFGIISKYEQELQENPARAIDDDVQDTIEQQMAIILTKVVWDWTLQPNGGEPIPSPRELAKSGSLAALRAVPDAITGAILNLVGDDEPVPLPSNSESKTDSPSSQTDQSNQDGTMPSLPESSSMEPLPLRPEPQSPTLTTV